MCCCDIAEILRKLLTIYIIVMVSPNFYMKEENKMLKRILAAILCASMIVTVAGCEKKNENQGDSMPDSDAIAADENGDVNVTPDITVTADETVEQEVVEEDIIITSIGTNDRTDVVRLKGLKGDKEFNYLYAYGSIIDVGDNEDKIYYACNNVYIQLGVMYNGTTNEVIIDEDDIGSIRRNEFNGNALCFLNKTEETENGEKYYVAIINDNGEWAVDWTEATDELIYLHNLTLQDLEVSLHTLNDEYFCIEGLYKEGDARKEVYFSELYSIKDGKLTHLGKLDPGGYLDSEAVQSEYFGFSPVMIGDKLHFNVYDDTFTNYLVEYDIQANKSTLVEKHGAHCWQIGDGVLLTGYKMYKFYANDGSCTEFNIADFNDSDIEVKNVTKERLIFIYKDRSGFPTENYCYVLNKNGEYDIEPVRGRPVYGNDTHVVYYNAEDKNYYFYTYSTKETVNLSTLHGCGSFGYNSSMNKLYAYDSSAEHYIFLDLNDPTKTVKPF